MALSLQEKYVLLAILAAVMIFVVFFEMRYMRGKAKVVRNAAVKKDQAFNSVLTTRSVINVMARQGADTRSAQDLVSIAKQAMERGEYDRCIDLCETARNELMTPGGTRAAPRAAEREQFEEVTGSIVSTPEPKREADSYKGTKLPVGQDGNFMSAKFELNTAKADIKKAMGRGVETLDAQEALTQAEAAFVTGNYTKALSLAVKARKAISQEAAVEAIPLRASEEEPEEPEAEPTPEEVSGPAGVACRECGAALESGDMFCHKCGARVVIEIFCGACGEKARPADAFCRKCGTRIP